MIWYLERAWHALLCLRGTRVPKNEYEILLKKKDYKQMYQMLNPKIVYTPTQKYFVEKYKEFYEEIDAKNIQIKI